MSIDTKQLVHIAIETTVISVLFVFFYNKNRVLCEQIDELETVVSQQQETLQKHEAMIMNLSNSIKLLKNTQYHKYDTESSSDSDNEPEPDIILKPLESSVQVDPVESDAEEQEQIILPIDQNRSTKAEKKKKKKKKKKVEQTEQMLDNELLEELKDLE
jgi:hypothetical protein